MPILRGDAIRLFQFHKVRLRVEVVEVAALDTTSSLYQLRLCVTETPAAFGCNSRQP